jgi:2-succinyl-5-enolpyruvyl-6-hydroxy-3-cyclohexene-1-carboxylate synthase
MAHAGPVALLIGDVAFRHDVSGLAAAAALESPFAVVVLDDGGGRIFGELPIGARADLVDQMHHFTTPGPSRAQRAAALYDLPFAAPRTRAALRAALKQAMMRGGASVILADVSHEDGSRLDRALRAEPR